MITEDYVSFEVAKLLKDKGFDQNCATYYLDGQVWRHYHGEVIPKGKQIYAAPTQTIAMKWLREVHNIHFLFDPYLDENYNIRYSIIVVFGSNLVDPIYKTDGDFTYEQACEAAIKYCLENLI